MNQLEERMLSRRSAYRLVIGILLLGMTLGLAACRPMVQPAQTPEATNIPPTTASQSTTGPGQTTGSIKVTDDVGREVKLDKLPQRIVVVGRASYMVLHMLYLFPEGRERLVGFDKKPMTSMEFLQLIDPNLSDRVVLEGTPGVEQIAALKPDLVLMKSPAAEDVNKGLGEVGIPVVYLGLETPTQFEKDLANLGLLLGSAARAQEIAAFYQSRLDIVERALAGIAEAQKPRVLLCQYSTKGNEVAVSVPAEAWMQTIQVKKAGGIPVWLENAEPASGWKVINLEQVVQWNPDQIVIVAYSADPEEITAKLRADPIWSALDAVKQGHLHIFPADFIGWDMPDPRWILGTEWLATRFYPDRLADLNMADEVHQFFSQIYGMDESAVDAQVMPKVKLDVH